MSGLPAIKDYLSDKLGKEVLFYKTSWYGGCPTCDFGTGRIYINFADGTTTELESQFGIMLQEIIEYADQEMNGEIKGGNWTHNLERLFDE